MQQPASNVLDTIGNTPLIRLARASEETGCLILGKAEYMNPGASVKDRAALGIVRDGEQRQQIERGGVIVEGTAGNTGIGLAVVGNALGYRTVIVMPNTQSREKVSTLRAYGAEVIEIPAVPFKNPAHFVHESERVAERLRATENHGVLWANQFDNVANREFHERTTGAEIWQQTEGKVDGFICSVGTGGTLGGVARALKQYNPAIRIGLADPNGSALYNYYRNGELRLEGSSITEGIGNSRITANLEDTPIDVAYQIPDEVAIPLVFDLVRHEGLCLGGSSGINVAGAMALARELGPGHTIVTILCDTGLRYLQRLYNPAFLAEKSVAIPDWLT
ncbi:MAG: cysteine synthase A [Gammaproteobacteria bacterium]|nr:cysteine synthase A [Gammaproteobacteria bacterium]